MINNIDPEILKLLRSQMGNESVEPTQDQMMPPNEQDPTEDSPYAKQVQDIRQSPEYQAKMEEQKRKIAERNAMQSQAPTEAPMAAPAPQPEAAPTQDPRLAAALEQQSKQRRYSDLLRGFQQMVAAGGGIRPDYSMADIMNQRADEPVTQYKQQVAQEAASKKDKREEQESKLRMDEFQMRLDKTKLDFTDMKANSDPKSPQSKIAQDRVIEMQSKMGQPVNEEQIRTQSGSQLFKYFDYLKQDLTQYYQNENARLDREQRSKHDEAMIKQQQLTQKMYDEDRDESRKLREMELNRRQELDSKTLDKSFRKEARDVLKDLRATETWKAAEKAANAIEEIEPLLADAEKKGGQSLAMLGPRIAKGIAGEVGVLTESDVTRYVKNPTLIGGMMDSIDKITQGKITEVSAENLKRLMTIVKSEAKRKRDAAINNEAILFSRRNDIPVEQARTYIDSEFNPQSTQKESTSKTSESDSVMMQPPDGTAPVRVKKDKVQKYLDKGAKIVE